MARRPPLAQRERTRTPGGGLATGPNAPSRLQGDEAALLARVVRGDRDALGALYDRLAPTMLAFGYRLLGSQREAEDLVHDVFLEAWRNAHHYQPERASVRAWLFLRMRSRALDRLRSARRAPAVTLDEALLVQQHTTPDAVALGDGQILHGILPDLPHDQRAVLELGYFGGYSSAEIAERLAIPIGTVKSRMSRALVQLRLRLQDLEGVES